MSYFHSWTVGPKTSMGIYVNIFFFKKKLKKSGNLERLQEMCPYSPLIPNRRMTPGVGISSVPRGNETICITYWWNCQPPVGPRLFFFFPPILPRTPSDARFPPSLPFRAFLSQWPMLLPLLETLWLLPFPVSASRRSHLSCCPHQVIILLRRLPTLTTVTVMAITQANLAVAEAAATVTSVGPQRPHPLNTRQVHQAGGRVLDQVYAFLLISFPCFFWFISNLI